MKKKISSMKLFSDGHVIKSDQKIIIRKHNESQIKYPSDDEAKSEINSKDNSICISEKIRKRKSTKYKSHFQSTSEIEYEEDSGIDKIDLKRNSIKAGQNIDRGKQIKYNSHFQSVSDIEFEEDSENKQIDSKGNKIKYSSHIRSMSEIEFKENNDSSGTQSIIYSKSLSNNGSDHFLQFNGFDSEGNAIKTEKKFQNIKPIESQLEYHSENEKETVESFDSEKNSINFIENSMENQNEFHSDKEFELFDSEGNDINLTKKLQKTIPNKYSFHPGVSSESEIEGLDSQDNPIKSIKKIQKQSGKFRPHFHSSSEDEFKEASSIDEIDSKDTTSKEGL